MFEGSSRDTRGREYDTEIFRRVMTYKDISAIFRRVICSLGFGDASWSKSASSACTSGKNKDLVHTTLGCEIENFWCENREDLHENLFSHQLNCFHTKTNLFQALQTWHVQFTPGGMKQERYRKCFTPWGMKRIIFDCSNVRTIKSHHHHQYVMLDTIVVHSHHLLQIHILSGFHTIFSSFQTVKVCVITHVILI